MLSSLQLAQEAKDYKFNTAIPLRIYLKTCIGILDKAQLSFQNGDNSGAFMYYYRYVDLCTNKLSKHPEFLISGKFINGQLNNTNCDPDLILYRQEYLQLIKLEVPAVLKIIEDLKRKIDDDWERHQVSLAKNIAKNRLQPPLKHDYKTLPPSFHEHTFQQSLNFFQGTKLNSREGKTTTSSSNTKENNTINKSENVQTTQTPTEQNNSSSNSLLLYPELPQLSFPTF